MKRFRIFFVCLISSLGFSIFAWPAFGQTVPMNQLTDRVSLAYLTNHVRTLQLAGGHWSRVTFTPGSDSGVAYIKRQLDALAHLSSVTLDTFYIPSANVPLNTRPQFNIVASIAGTLEPSKHYVVGAHHDCSGSRNGSTAWNAQWATMRVPGADDNATGVAIMLEVARILSDPSFGFVSKYTVDLVAFGAEESSPADKVSHVGSTHYAQAAKARGEEILGMVSVDMVGCNKNYYYQDIVANSNTGSQSLGQAFAMANVTYSLGLTTNQAPFISGTYSDHEAFWTAGYPAICLIEFAPPWNSGPYYTASPYYHTFTDTIETVNMELVRRVAKLTVASIASLSGTVTGIPEEPAVVKDFALAQNYPNPFNPSTNIRYHVGQTGHVRLDVFSVLGEAVATLVDAVQPAGDYTVTWGGTTGEGKQLSAGMYIYRMTAGSYSSSKKMILLK